jgi:hypothetical protein
MIVTNAHITVKLVSMLQQLVPIVQNHFSYFKIK